MIDGQDYKRLLHSHRMKSTKPRNAVLSVLGEKDCALTAEEIYRALVQKGDGVNFSTVYRVLELFAEKRLVTKTFFFRLEKLRLFFKNCGAYASPYLYEVP